MAEQKRDLTISFVRMVAMICIVACHIMQYDTMELAWWLNVGVQIFLCISGYLYGKKQIEKIGAFYRKNFAKILVDYEIVIVVALLATAICTETVLTMPTIVGALLSITTIAGGAHLWFIPTILLCYLLTPLYAALCDRAEQKSVKRLLCSGVALFWVNELIFRQMTSYFNAAWINCYLLGFALRRLQQYPLWHKIFVSGIAVLGGVFLSIQICVRYLQLLPLSDPLRMVYYPMCDYGHVCLGLILFCLGRRFAHPLCQIPWIQRMVQVSDTYSYQIYLTHHFFILGPFSLMACTACKWCNLLLVVLLTLLTAILLQKLSATITRWMRKYA